MTLAAPLHALAPAWTAKDLVEKERAVAAMAETLAAFADRLGGVGAPDPDPALDDHLERRRIKLLGDFERLLAPARRALQEDLRQAVPADPAEESDIAAIRQLIEAHPDFLTAGCETGHVTGSALLIDREEGTLLLHRHRKLGRWFQFGGHPDFELNMLDVALREAREESGIRDLSPITIYARTTVPIDVELQRIPATATRPAHLHADFRYVLTAPRLNPVVADGEESEDFWILTFDDAMVLSDAIIEPALRRLISKARLLARPDPQ